MSSREPARRAARSRRSMILAIVVVVSAALITAVGQQLQAPSSRSLATPPSSTRPSSTSSPSSRSVSAPPSPVAKAPSGQPPRAPSTSDTGGVLGPADGLVPDGVTVFDGDVPAVANLEPELLGALRRAATVAAGDGVDVAVTSGWRSPAYQEHLLRDAVAEYGSEAEAARWVATPETSRHVSGDAIDIGSPAGTWLSRHGATYGLCAIYDNEPWHYELRPDAVAHGCPDTYADPTHDPRMQP